jgi:Holliday junction DNA helicase RuvA
MIAKLTGKVDEKLSEVVVIDVRGVGYGVFVCQEDYLTLKQNNEVKLYIYEHVREQAHDLYGFTDLNTKKLFELLLSVNGVGPKMALSILSIGQSDNLRQAIAEGNRLYIQKASGVGKRVAERLIVDLKDKVGLVASDNSFSLAINSTQDEAVEALISLGFSPIDAIKALSRVDNNLTVEERVKSALKGV